MEKLCGRFFRFFDSKVMMIRMWTSLAFLLFTTVFGTVLFFLSIFLSTAETTTTTTARSEGDDFAVKSSSDQFVVVRTNAPAGKDATVSFYVNIESCDKVQGIVNQRLIMKKMDLPYTLRQQLPESSKSLDRAIGKIADEQSLSPGVTALRGSGVYKKGVNDSVVASEMKNAGEYNLQNAVTAANEQDEKIASEEETKIVLEPPIAGRGVMIDPNGDLVVWSRDELGVWRGISAASCASLKGSWHHVALVQQSRRVVAYVDGKETGRIVMSGHQGDQYTNVWTLGRFNSGGPKFPFQGAFDRLRIFNRALISEEIVCGLRGSAVSSSGLLANAMMNEGKGTQIAATPALATIQLDGDAKETKWQTGAVQSGVPAVPALPENQVCEAVAKEMSLSDPSSPPPINELHLVSAAGSCPNDCSGNGRCNYETGVCFCFTGFIGIECQIENYAGYALQFDSRAQQRMKLLPMGRFRSASYSMWINPSDVTGWRSLVSHVSEDGSPGEKGTSSLELSDGKVRFSVIGNRPEQLLFETSLKAHEWKLLTLTYSQEHRGRLGTGSASIYLNGLLKETLSFEQSGEIYLGDGWVGGQKPQGHFFAGEIDELRIWSKALSPMEVLTETSGRIRGTAPGLQAYYRFDEGSGRIAVDVARDPSSGDENEEEEDTASEKDSIPTRFDALLEPSSRPPQFVPSQAPMKPCPGKPSPCSSRGQCVDGKCSCINGYTGEACDKEACPGACSGHGMCVELDASDGAGALEALGLDVNAFVKSVQENVAPSIASVVDGPIEKIVEDDTSASNAKTDVVSRGSTKVANMTAGLLGSVVAKMFSSGGEMKGRCVCEEPYAPPSCASVRCPSDCSGHGTCSEGECVCDEGFTGFDCSELVCVPSPDCSKNGDCIEGVCVCFAGFTDEACSTRETCPNDCSGHGKCGRGGICECDAKYSGRDCAWSVGCENFCSGRGSCVEDKCVCSKMFTGPDCSRAACPNDCSGRGDCVGGLCMCEAGYEGDDCSQESLWPLRCVTVRRGMESTSECTRGWKKKVAVGSKVLELKFASEDDTLPTATVLESKK